MHVRSASFRRLSCVWGSALLLTLTLGLPCPPGLVAAEAGLPQPPADADPDLFWGEYLAGQDVKPADLHKAIRTLFRKGEFEHVIGLAGAAIRNNQGQPWMYEVLGLAMQAGGRPEAEIDRALMSALDLEAVTPTRLRFVAKYMQQNGLKSRALKLYRQAGQIAPHNSEPYLDALELAQELSDVDTLQWALVGILSQAWSEDNRNRWEMARAVAAETVSELRAMRRFQAADALEQQVAEASIRDLEIVVSWTGEADIDLLVEEPGGTVCSAESPTTTSGGVMLGDNASRIDRRASRRISETYFCSQAFPGKYQVRIRRAWGKPTSDQVTVELVAHENDPARDRKRIKQQIRVGDDDSAVVFRLAEGRRTESVEDQLLATAFEQQAKIQRSLVLRQLNSLDSSYEGQAAQRSQLAARERRRKGGNAAVGYQPVIITLSEGATATFQAVVSADRRYVRFTGVPFFSGIGDVQIFSTSGGDLGQQGGGGGGGVGVGGGGGGAVP